MNLRNNFEDILGDETILESTLIAFSETWLDKGENLPIDGYDAHFNSIGPGKGIAIYYKKDIFKHVIDIEKENMQLTKMESLEMTVIAVYRSEKGNSVELLQHIIELIPPRGRTIICGDFNICYLSKRRNRITKYLEENGFTQLVKEATHIQGRLLDHFYFRPSPGEHLETPVFRYSP